MTYTNSQEQTIYRSLAGQIQLGFYDDGERFPSAQEIARHYNVSYCPARRALKMLEQDGLIRVSRGKWTDVIAKPYLNFLKTDIFQERKEALADLAKSLELISPAVCFRGLSDIDASCVMEPSPQSNGTEINRAKYLYRLFSHVLQFLGSQTVLSLYYDAGSFAQSAFLDILNSVYEKEEKERFLQSVIDGFLKSVHFCQNGFLDDAARQLEQLSKTFFGVLGHYFENAVQPEECGSRNSFSWEPFKGRTRYYDIIAMDLICKINQGIYPVGSLLPKNEMLADRYHTSLITMRRTVALLNKLDVADTINGVGTRVLSAGGASILSKFSDLMLDSNFKILLEAAQLLALTCEPVIRYSFSYFTPESLNDIRLGAQKKNERNGLEAVISAVLQAIIQYCPLNAVKEIYSKITQLLLKGSILHFEGTGREPIPGWIPLSHEIQTYCQPGGGAAFARTFRTLAENSFEFTKQILITIGAAGIEEVVSPAVFEKTPDYSTV